MHRTAEELQQRLAEIRAAPADDGPLLALFARPEAGTRRRLQDAELDRAHGLVGDNWRTRGSRRTPDGSAHPDQQITLMNARALAAIAGSEERWSLAGDQLIVDLDVGARNLPAGTLLEIGTATVVITELPHTGCAKFAARFGLAALSWVNSPAGRELNLRGVNARVVRSGRVWIGDRARKLAPD